MRVAGLLGKLEPRRPDGLADLVAYAARKLPTAPAELDFTTGVSSWEMADNDRLGDCTIAAVTHMDKCWSAQTQESYTYPGDSTIDSTYFGLSGGQDSGLVEADVLSAWMNDGLFGRKIIGYAPVNIKDITTMKAALHLFGGLYVGVQVPAIAQDQFANGQEWNPTGDPSVDNNIVGGHAIPLLGYDSSNTFKAVTWGATQLLTLDWWKMYGDEAWAIIPQEFADAAKSLNIDIQGLQSDLPLAAD